MAYYIDQGSYMTSGEAAAQTGAALRTVNKWAAANGVAYTGEGRRKTYIWSEQDLERFAKRRTKGRPKKTAG